MASAIPQIVALLGPLIIDQIRNSGSNQQYRPQGGNWFSGYPAQHLGFSPNFDPQKMGLFNDYIKNFGQGQGSLGQGAFDVLRQQMQPFDPGQYEQLFQQGVVDPSLRNYNQEILPSIISRFGGGTSGALNRAIASSSANLGKDLASMRANYISQAQPQWRSQQAQSAAQSLGLYNQAFNTQSQSPVFQQPQQGQGMDLLQSIIALGGQLGASYFDPSRQQGQSSGQSNYFNPASGQNNYANPHSLVQQMGQMASRPPSIYGSSPYGTASTYHSNFDQFIPQAR